jgi:hypothetical protein
MLKTSIVLGLGDRRSAGLSTNSALAETLNAQQVIRLRQVRPSPACSGEMIPTTAFGTANLRPRRTSASDSALAQKGGHYVQNELSVIKAIRSGAYLRQPSAVPIRSPSMRGRMGAQPALGGAQQV